MVSADCSTKVLGIGGLDHNASVTLIEDGRVRFFLEAERPSRKKNIGLRDEATLELLLDHLSLTAVEYIGVADKTFWKRRKAWLEPAIIERFGKAPHIWAHHDCHVASTLVASPWNRALCISIDGKGDDLSAMAAIVSRNHGIEQRLITIPSAHSLGRLWWAVSEFCGFLGHHSAGKTMALAATGHPFDLFDSATTLCTDGSFRFVAPHGHRDTFRQVPRIQKWITAEIARRGLTSEVTAADVAASLQILNNRVVAHLVKNAVHTSGVAQVCLAGGVALNGLTNQYLVDQRIVDQLFVVPCCDDRGLSLGAAALTSANSVSPIGAPSSVFSPFLGPTPTVPNVLPGWRKTDENLHDVAGHISGGAIVAWFSGRDEAGPRALGHRSILATPTRPQIRNKLNELKGRESFRPFGCVVAEGDLPKWFSLDGASPYMLRIAPGTEAAQRHIPAVLHVDGTSRVQTVRPGDGSTLAPLLDALASVGHPRVILNTSLNQAGEPLAHTANDAADVATRLGADFLLVDAVCYAPADLHDSLSSISSQTRQHHE